MVGPMDHGQTRIVLPRGFLLAGRQRGYRAATPSPIPAADHVVAPSREEALAIVCASLLGDGDKVDAARPRGHRVRTRRARDRLIDSPHSLVLIPNFQDADVASALTRSTT